MEITKNLIWYAEQLQSIAQEYESIKDKHDYIFNCIKEGQAKHLKTLSKQLKVIANQIIEK